MPSETTKHVASAATRACQTVSLFTAASMTLLTLFPGAAAYAQEEKPRAALLHTSAAEGVRQGYAGAIDRMLRARLDALSVVRIRGSVALDLSEIQLALGCVGETPECLAQIAQQIEVDELLLPNIDRAGDQLILNVARFDAENGEIHRVARTARGDAAETELLEATDGLLRELYHLPPPEEAPSAGETDDESSTLEAADSQSGTGSDEAPEPNPSNSSTLLIASIPALALGAGGLIGGAVVGWLSQQQQSAYNNDGAGPNDKARANTLLNHGNSARTLATVADALFIAGGSLLAAGAVLLILGLLDNGHDGRGQSMIVAPMLGPGLAGLTLSATLPDHP